MLALRILIFLANLHGHVFVKRNISLVRRRCQTWRHTCNRLKRKQLLRDGIRTLNASSGNKSQPLHNIILADRVTRGPFLTSPLGDPLGPVKFSVRPSILLNSRECSPLGAKFAPRGKLHPWGQTHVVKNWPHIGPFYPFRRFFTFGIFKVFGLN
jgi:hypothetical protein